MLEGTNVEIGRCPLCLTDGKELQDSHFISQGVYRLVEDGRAPIVMTPEVFVATSRQVKDYLLCGDCEQMFGKRGENYVIPLLRQDRSRFPLLNLLKANTPLGRTQAGSFVYSGSASGIDTDRLAYYALSMFWRASVHVWKTLNQQTASISLGVYEESIRRFLHCEGGFPEGVLLKVAVCSDIVSQGLVFAPVEWTDDKFIGYEMMVLGACFTMIVGVEGEAKEWNSCCVNSANRVIFLEDFAETARHHYLDLRERARIAKNLSR